MVHSHSSYQEDDYPIRYDATQFASRVPVHVAQVVGTDARGDEVAVLLALVRLHLCRFTTKVGLAELCGIGIDFGSPCLGHMRCHSLVICMVQCLTPGSQVVSIRPPKAPL